MLIRRFERRFAGTVELQIDEAAAEAVVKPEESLGLYEIAEAALDNILRHAQAEQVWVRLAASGGRVGPTLSIRDNGMGFVLGAAMPGTGSSVMGYYLQTGGFDLQIETAAGSGTNVHVACKKAPRSTGQALANRTSSFLKRGSHEDGH